MAMRLFLSAIAVLLALATPARADFAAGWAAYRSGDHAGALRHWLPLAVRGDLDAIYDVGVLYENGLGVARDRARAADWYRRAAERRFAPAQYRLARLHETADRPDSDKALLWYRRAAEQDLAEAQFNLGVAYEIGSLVTAEPTRAAEWYQRAADQGLAAAQYNLGRLRASGLGVSKDMARAVELYRRAADQGFAPAQNNLGYMNEKGIHLPRDRARAVDWYRKAAAQGFAKAQTNLGIMLNFGTGVVRNYAEAARWYRAAAMQGNGEAQTFLALLLANGQGMERDFVEAYAWLTLAAGDGSDGTARDYRDRLTPLLDREQIAQATRRAKALRRELAGIELSDGRALPKETAEFGRADLTVQRRLVALGLYTGIVDGLVGPGTLAAIRVFQRQAGLKVDGRITPALIEALDAALRARAENTNDAPAP